MPALYELARPFAFMTAKGPTLSWYRDLLPFVIAVTATAIYFALPVPPKLVGSDSLSTVLAPLFAGLPGFFIAALAAVATFQGGDLDRDMKRTTIWIRANGDGMDTTVTLRVFLSHLFAYLTLLSIIGFLACAGAALLAGNAVFFQRLAAETKTWWDDAAWQTLKGIYVFLIAIVTGSVLSCTALGLYFLAERIHQELE